MPVEDPIFDTIVVVAGLATDLSSRVNNLGLPVVLDEDLEIFSIRGSGVGDIMIREPSLQFSFVPLVVN